MNFASSFLGIQTGAVNKTLSTKRWSRATQESVFVVGVDGVSRVQVGGGFLTREDVAHGHASRHLVAKPDLEDQHGITVAEEAEPLSNGALIGLALEFNPGEGGNQHQKGGTG